MKAKTFSDLLKKGDRVAVSNITGREASKVSVISQLYCCNIVGGWALGKGGQKIDTSIGPISVFATFEELLHMLPVEDHPNKILIYSHPGAVFGEVKEVLKYGKSSVETIFVVTENVPIEVTAKINKLCKESNVDIIGCNTLGAINVHDKVRIGAVGGYTPEEAFKPGSVSIISNSGNMVNTIASYLLSIGMGTSFGISTGKDKLILFPLKDFLTLAEKDENTKIIVLYIEPGGVYEREAIDMLKEGYSKPIIVYVSGEIAEKYDISLGHAGAVVEGGESSARVKKAAFDNYFRHGTFEIRKTYKEDMSRGVRVEVLHHIPKAVSVIAHTLGIKKDYKTKTISLNPWRVNLREFGKHLPTNLSLPKGAIPEPYRTQFKEYTEATGVGMIRQPMRNISHASSNDGRTPRIYGCSLTEIMKNHSFVAALVLYWTGELPKDEFEEKLAEMTLIASLTNGPGTISAQGAKLSTSAGNRPNTAMIGTLASLGLTHGGNGAKAVRYLLGWFSGVEIKDPYAKFDVKIMAVAAVHEFKKIKTAAKDAGIEYERIPCLGHPVFNKDAVNHDPREVVIRNFIKESGKTNVFLEFYHHVAQGLKDTECTSRVMAVNVDAAVACVWLSICWDQIKEKHMTTERAMDIPFIAFCLGRVAGGAGEFLDHQDFGTQMDMRVPVSECKSLTRPRKI